MDFSGLVKTTGRAAYRNWRTEPRKPQYDEWYFKALIYRVQTLDDMVVRSALFLERDAWMKEGY